MSEHHAGSSSEIPWSAVFDPSVNVRALGEIQARGFRAATELVDRFVRTTDAPGGHAASASDRHGGPTAENSGPAAPSGFASMISAWQGLVSQWADTVQTAPANRRGACASVDLPMSAAEGCVAIHAAVREDATAVVWLHNSGDTDLGEVRLRCGDLMAHDGSRITSEAIGFDPGSTSMPSRSSRGVRVVVGVTAETRAGIYHGTLLVHGHPGVWLPVTLTVPGA
ncbi:hypothetical protein [Mycolicibacterium tokaiense]|uniref:Uncharacterized protein n=1 Tax=Mycolicibacterium tokaiense TaxID=39695 RepID=A0A378TB45_9MYCO|nr:hypothetical protein [Mycolicibacterium tokaiense]BBY87509.1 hypothetical protein MTOK_32910 [Mycolicibacterium tokaiense]STZ57969.1 Uncharacterised protein [Mycolicibacterium tokaiense]